MAKVGLDTGSEYEVCVCVVLVCITDKVAVLASEVICRESDANRHVVTVLEIHPALLRTIRVTEVGSRRVGEKALFLQHGYVVTWQKVIDGCR